MRAAGNVGTAVGPGTSSLTEKLFAGLLLKGAAAVTATQSSEERVSVGGPADEHGGARLDHRRVCEPEMAPVTLVEYAVFGLPHYGVGDESGWFRQQLVGLYPTEGALGEYLAPLPPGERLATLLAALDLERVDDYSLVEVVAAHKRMEAWSAANAAKAAAALAQRPALNPTWPGSVKGRTRGECLAGHELAMRLRVSRVTATRLAAAGRAFQGLLRETGEALEAGLIDFPRAQAIFTVLDPLPAEVALAAQWEVLEAAPGRTLRQLQQDLAKAVIAVDPQDADARHRVARQQRRVYRPRPLPEGMASVTAVLTAVDAIALDSALDAASRAAKHNGATRTLDQLRADCLALMGHTALAQGYIGPHPSTGCSCGCRTTTSSTTIAADPPDVDDETGTDTADPGGRADPRKTPSPVAAAGSATAGAEASDLLADPAAAVAVDVPDLVEDAVGRAATAAATGTPPLDTAGETDTAGEPDDAGPTGAGDHGAAAGTTKVEGTGVPEATRPEGSGVPDETAVPEGSGVPVVAEGPPHPGHRLPGGLLPLVRLGTLGGLRPDVRITVPLSVVLPDLHAPPAGSAVEREPEAVAELEGYGPISPEVARALAAGGVWRRLVTDPVTGQVLDVGRTRYRPPAAMAALVRERDRTCIKPSCATSARASELDHIHEWQDGGETSVWNLGPMCRGDHPIKTMGVLTVARASDGTYAWTTATEHGYLRRRDGTTVMLPRRTARELRAIGKEQRRTGIHLDPAVVDAVLAQVAAGSDAGGSWTPPALPQRPTPADAGRQDGPSFTHDTEPPF